MSSYLAGWMAMRSRVTRRRDDLKRSVTPLDVTVTLDWRDAEVIFDVKSRSMLFLSRFQRFPDFLLFCNKNEEEEEDVFFASDRKWIWMNRIKWLKEHFHLFHSLSFSVFLLLKTEFWQYCFTFTYLLKVMMIWSIS